MRLCPVWRVGGVRQGPKAIKKIVELNGMALGVEHGAARPLGMALGVEHGMARLPGMALGARR